MFLLIVCCAVLNFEIEALVITDGPRNVTVCSGTNAKIPCGFTGVPDPISLVQNLTWRIIKRSNNGDAIRNETVRAVNINANKTDALAFQIFINKDGNNITSANKSYLSVGPVDDTYNNTSYQCIFTINDSIIESDTAGTVTVIGTPSSPVLTYESTLNEILVSWSPVDSDTVCGLVTYNITVMPSHGMIMMINDTVYNITGLNYNATYTITVYANNDHTSGEPAMVNVKLISVNVTILDTQTVGQSIKLQCEIITGNGITSKVDIIWSSDGIELERMNNVSSTAMSSLLVYTHYYTISQLNTTDDDRVIQCEGVINANASVIASDRITLDVIVPTPPVTITPSGDIQVAMVGNPRVFNCAVSTVSGVESSSVMISWMGPGGVITSDSKVTISPTTSSGNTYTSSVQFTYLVEGDEGTYTCNVMILETNGSQSVELQSLTIPTPTVSATPLHTQIVGQSVTLQCEVTTVRGITSRVDIVWSSNGTELERMNNVSSSTMNSSLVYTDYYNISRLSTPDDDRVIQCEGVINANTPVMASDSITLDVTVPNYTVTISPFGPIQGAIVGSPQIINCTVSTVSGVESSSVMISWMRPGGVISGDSRVTISPTTSSGNTYTSILQFTYLMEGDEGTYTCNVMILKTNGSQSVELQSMIIPAASVSVRALTETTVGQSVVLQCEVTTVRGITSRVDIVWSSNRTELERMNNVSSTRMSNSLVYADYYTISQLSTTDDDRVIQCEGAISANTSVMASNSTILYVTVPIPRVTILPSGHIKGAMVGSSQVINCIVSTVSGVESSSVMINWMGPGGVITSNSRVTISPTTSSGNTYTSSLQFAYLMEGDEGTYICNVMILETNGSQSVELLPLNIPTPTVSVTALNTLIVGQSVTLQCEVTIVRGIPNRVDIVWSSDGIELERMNNVSSSTMSSSLVYTDYYTISQLGTTDDDRVIQCEVVINANTSVMTNDNITLDVTVPTPTITMSPSGPIQGAMVSSPQVINCTVSTVSGVESSSVMISWMGQGGFITSDSRVTISPTTSSGNTYTSSLQFTYLMEGDEGKYTCNVIILETNGSQSVELLPLTIPTPNVNATALDIQKVGQSVTLQCEMTTVRGITSRVDIVWSSDGIELERMNNVSSTTMSSSLVYTDYYTISQLSTTDDDRVIQCEGVINANASVMASDSITLDVNGGNVDDDINIVLLAGIAGGVALLILIIIVIIVCMIVCCRKKDSGHYKTKIFQSHELAKADDTIQNPTYNVVIKELKESIPHQSADSGELYAVSLKTVNDKSEKPQEQIPLAEYATVDSNKNQNLEHILTGEYNEINETNFSSDSGQATSVEYAVVDKKKVSQEEHKPIAEYDDASVENKQITAVEYAVADKSKKISQNENKPMTGNDNELENKQATEVEYAVVDKSKKVSQDENKSITELDVASLESKVTQQTTEVEYALVDKTKKVTQEENKPVIEYDDASMENKVNYAELQDLSTNIRNIDVNKDATVVYTQVV